MTKIEDILNVGITREELYSSDRGEREYYKSRSKTKAESKQRMKIPITTDGCLAILEYVTEAMDIPLDETVVQVFNGYIHHLPQTENSFSFDDVMKLLHNHMSKSVTWKLDQDVKDLKARKNAEKVSLVGENVAIKDTATADAVQ